MRLVYYVFVPFLFLSQLVLTSAQESKQNTKCPVFQCGRFGKVGFPFSNTSNPECGLYVLDCSGTQIKVKCEEGEEWRDVYHLNYSTKRMDFKYQADPTQAMNGTLCPLKRTYTHQLSPFLSIIDLETRLFIKCKHGLDPTIPSDRFHGLVNYTGCKGYDLLYSHDPLQCLPETLSKRCFPVYLPSTSLQSLHSCLADSLTSSGDGIFQTNWQVNPICWDCHREGVQCLTSQNGAVVCGNTEEKREGNTGRKVGIGVGTGVGGILLTCALFILYQRRKRNKLNSSSALISRSISGDPSLKQDLEQGSIYFQTPIFTYKELDEATNHFDTNKSTTKMD